LGDRTVVGYGLRDAADLLDDPSFAQEFIERDRAPYWAQLWPAAVMLAEHLWAAPAGAGRSAIELGCGLGLVTISAALRGWSVTASDYDTRALAFVRANARLNGVAPADLIELDWSSPPALHEYDLVVAADVLYERPNQPFIVALLKRLIAPQGTAIIADPNRPAASGFIAELTRAGLIVETSIVRTAQPGAATVDGTLYRVARPTESGVARPGGR
jgi:predicted nicotinamide N-methyase